MGDGLASSSSGQVVTGCGTASNGLRQVAIVAGDSDGSTMNSTGDGAQQAATGYEQVANRRTTRLVDWELGLASGVTRSSAEWEVRQGVIGSSTSLFGIGSSKFLGHRSHEATQIMYISTCWNI